MLMKRSTTCWRNGQQRADKMVNNMLMKRTCWWNDQQLADKMVNNMLIKILVKALKTCWTTLFIVRNHQWHVSMPRVGNTLMFQTLHHVAVDCFISTLLMVSSECCWSFHQHFVDHFISTLSTTLTTFHQQPFHQQPFHQHFVDHFIASCWSFH